MSRFSRSLAPRLLAALFAAFSASDLWQVIQVLAGRAQQPTALAAEHALAGLVGATAAVGLWRGARWAAGAVVAWGLLTAVMIATLPALLGLPREARSGIWAAAAVVLALALLVARFAAKRDRRAAA